MLKPFKLFTKTLDELPSGKLLISTINAHSFNVTKTDPAFAEALRHSDVLIPDGVSIALAARILMRKRIKKIAGADLFAWEMARLNRIGGKAMFLGSSVATLEKMLAKAAIDYPNVEITVYSPPFKPEFSEAEDDHMMGAINACVPDVLFVGMTAPKQEKWAYRHFARMNAGHVCCVGAVFDFYAGNIDRAPQWLIHCGMEWLYRLVREPRRLWRRYLIGNSKFLLALLSEFVPQFRTPAKQRAQVG